MTSTQFNYSDGRVPQSFGAHLDQPFNGKDEKAEAQRRLRLLKSGWKSRRSILGSGNFPSKASPIVAACDYTVECEVGIRVGERG